MILEKKIDIAAYRWQVQHVQIYCPRMQINTEMIPQLLYTNMQLLYHYHVLNQVSTKICRIIILWIS